jgi:hypothetical protein
MVYAVVYLAHYHDDCPAADDHNPGPHNGSSIQHQPSQNISADDHDHPSANHNHPGTDHDHPIANHNHPGTDHDHTSAMSAELR